ncbi:hypothetical protein [Sphingomonas sp.]|uniref:hypothetical protein n=1 Tax=Sphingomonas sp. TaxID=28214 RepID=UPI0035C82B7A
MDRQTALYLNRSTLERMLSAATVQPAGDGGRGYASLDVDPKRLIRRSDAKRGQVAILRGRYDQMRRTLPRHCEGMACRLAAILVCASLWPVGIAHWLDIVGDELDQFTSFMRMDVMQAMRLMGTCVAVLEHGDRAA